MAKRRKTKANTWSIQSKIDGWVLEEAKLSKEDVEFILKAVINELLRKDIEDNISTDLVGNLLRVLDPDD